MTLEIQQITQLTDSLVATLAGLVPQLSRVLPVPDREQFQRVVDGPHSTLFVALGDGRVVGMLSLGWYDVCSGRNAWIEDVVVDDAVRGCGIGAKLVQAALECAKREGVNKILLTSSASRVAAHALYKKMGFVQHDTSVFCFKIEK